MPFMVPRRSNRRLRFRWPIAVASWVVVLAVLATGCGSSPDGGDTQPTAIVPDSAAPSARAPKTTGVASGNAIRIVFLGDSLSAGYGLAEADAFPARVGRALREQGIDVDVVNAGVSGDTSAGGLSRIDWILRTEPDIVVVELGANDALRGQPPSNTEHNLRAIIARSRESGARVLLLGMDVPTSMGLDYAGTFAALYPRISNALDVPFVPGFIRKVGLDPGLMQPDGLHPTAEGHAVLAASLVEELRELVAATD